MLVFQRVILPQLPPVCDTGGEGEGVDFFDVLIQRNIKNYPLINVNIDFCDNKFPY